MKKKSRKQSLKRRHEFRYHNVEAKNKFGKAINIKHPAYIFLSKGNLYIYVTLTHSNRIANCLVVKLRKNPNPKDKKTAYYVAEVKQDTMDRFGKRHDDWKIDLSDDNDIRSLLSKIKR